MNGLKLAFDNFSPSAPDKQPYLNINFKFNLTLSFHPNPAADVSFRFVCCCVVMSDDS
jgi:hypothetical protein